MLTRFLTAALVMASLASLTACVTPPHCEKWAEDMVRAHEEAGHLHAFTIVDPEGEALVWLDLAGNAMITEGVVWEASFADHLAANGWERTGECLMPSDYTRTATTWKQSRPIPRDVKGEEASR